MMAAHGERGLLCRLRRDLLQDLTLPRRRNGRISIKKRKTGRQTYPLGSWWNPRRLAIYLMVAYDALIGRAYRTCSKNGSFNRHRSRCRGRWWLSAMELSMPSLSVGLGR